MPRRSPACVRLICILAVLALASGCSRAPPEQRLREAVAALESAVESRQGGAVQERLSEDFIGPDGLDRKGARRLAQGLFLRNRDIGVVLGPLDVGMVGDSQARVGFTALVTGGSGAALPDSGRLYQVETEWTLEDGEWRMLAARWEPAARGRR